MPELPEVETVRRGLEPWLTGKRIRQVEIFHPRALREGSTIPFDSIIGARIERVDRRGKFLWFVLDRDIALVGHLGMSGQMLASPRKAQPEKHLRARIDFGDKKREFRFIDQRTFGWLSVESLVSNNYGLLPECCSHIAPDIFSEEFDEREVIAKVRGRKVEIKKALLNQEILSGIGNIYADEALWHAKIHPETPASKLSEIELKAIFKAVRRVMRSALKQGGTSFDDLYINVNGESGYFEVSLRAYGREDEPCRRCGTFIRRITFANRSSHFCPKCQRKKGVKARSRGKSRAKWGRKIPSKRGAVR
ncbi:MAG: bifunctional DNA-formamidopyrimidine glycosylase/DNA-(apurinic or apyrimidinic site) lyase [Actinobacteria bacterium]|nr:bifunctional DNA-formamidopyrimidine glycosylase/DNA-(apurinic or apyrimidinic site) lyase [Actinomycetota bacterium]